MLLVRSCRTLFRAVRNTILDDELFQGEHGLGRELHIRYVWTSMLDVSRTWFNFEWISRHLIREWVENKESLEHSGDNWVCVIICNPSADLFQQLLDSIHPHVVHHLFRSLDCSWRDSKSPDISRTRSKTTGKFDSIRNVQPLRLLACSYRVWNVANHDWWNQISIGNAVADGYVDPSFPSFTDRKSHFLKQR